MKKGIFNGESYLQSEQGNKEINELNIKNNILPFDKTLRLEENKYYIPTCTEKECKGSLKISINENSFIMNCVCDKNKNHKFNNIYFQTFEKFYVKEKIIHKCNICSNILECKDKYKCNKCDKSYCSSCFISDPHIKKDLNNLSIISNKCTRDQRDLIYYCLDCGEKVCPFCLTKYDDPAKNPHKMHKIINILKKMPTLYQINKLKEKIIKKSDALDSLFNSLDEWMLELNKKIERIKQNLRNEIIIIKKLFLNLNIDYVDYTYYSNIHSLLDIIEDYNNKFLKQFMESETFMRKTECIFDLLKFKEPEVIEENLNLRSYFILGEGNICENFTNEFLLCTNHQENCLELLSYDEDEDIFIIKNTLDFNKRISSLNFSPDKTKIYMCLEAEKAIAIANYNPLNNNLELSEDKVEMISSSKFYKCIHIDNDCFIAIDDLSIYIFRKNVLTNYKFSSNRELKMLYKIYDICQIDDKILLYSENSKLTFITSDNLYEEKVIRNIDCINLINSLIVINDYNCILVNCEKGIAIISLKEKELIQYIEWPEKISVKLFKDSIYIFGKNNFLYRMNIVENNLSLISKTKMIREQKFNAYNIYIKDEDVFIWGDKFYLLDKDDDE